LPCRVAQTRLGRLARNYRPTTRISRSDGPPLSRPPRLPPPGRPASGGGVGAAAVSAFGGEVGEGSVVIRTIWFFFVSSVQVLARDLVCTVCSTSKLVGLVSLIMVSVPSPCELKASMVAGLNPPLSVPRPMGSVARILPSSA